ncbi:hypothetical protein ACFVWG_23900 [Kribbella sp. NPDC058245]|uniref:hypothetical protein n=1 Tax=Kribbella sp. NPDC058245 TaxID=3346399 RepID=UPI0036EEA75F
MSNYCPPAEPSGISYNDLMGALLLIKVHSVEVDVPTAFSVPGQRNPAIRGDLTVLDGAQAGEKYEDALIFPKVLQGQLKSRVGQLVLGRLGQGVAKRGQSAPWRLDPATTADEAIADAHLRQVSPPAGTGAEPPF